MRTTFSLIAILALFTATAQVDINKMIQERMQQQQSGQPGQPVGGSMVDDNDPFVPNTFIGSFRMEMHFFKDGAEQKGSPNNMYYSSNEGMTLMHSSAAERPGQEMKILTDLKGKWTYTLMTDGKGKKTAMKSRKQKFVVAEDPSGTKKEPKITVTKEAREINGHTCTKVIVESEDGTWTGWMAKDVKAPFHDMARNTGQGKKRQGEGVPDGVDGMPMEFEWISADATQRMVSYVRDLVVGKVDESAFSMDGYEVMDMSGYGR
ncbi:MAG: DUF4412 domain-containing protein [Flavobacteriales bacterium]|nr:DUF4412 domain-containing protein [Flavobacteriales bacterium]